MRLSKELQLMLYVDVICAGKTVKTTDIGAKPKHCKTQFEEFSLQRCRVESVCCMRNLCAWTTDRVSVT